MFKPKSRKKRTDTIADGTKVLKQIGHKFGTRFDIHVVERFSRFKEVRRPVISWLFLIIVLTGYVFVQTRQLANYYIAEVPIRGGALKEGMVGAVANINPIYTSSSADNSLSRLIFSPLLKYDGHGKLTGDLARRWSVDDSGKIYTFFLRDNAFWHDGQPVVAKDVVFTIESLQHPDANSPLGASWRSVQTKAEGDHKVIFTLPNVYAPFEHSLVGLGVLPEHVLGEVRPSQLRGHRFNLAEPIGSGPFRFVDSAVIGETNNLGSGIVRFRLKTHDLYHFQKSKLDTIMLYVYSDREEMIRAFNDGELALAGGLVAADIPSKNKLEEIDEGISAENINEELGFENQKIVLQTASSRIYAVPRTSQVMLFFNNSDTLLKNKKLRQALAHAVDRRGILTLSGPYYISSYGVLLANQLGYNNQYRQPELNQKKAAELFESAGWKLAKDGYRYDKDDKQLSLTIIAQAEDIFPEVLLSLQAHFKAVGVKVNARIVSGETIQQDYISGHQYQSLLFGINQGHDPDQFAFWHSSQSGINGRNLSVYKSNLADAALEAGRTRIDESLRKAKYEAFQKIWSSDTPAISLYQPAYIYISKKQVRGIDLTIISDASDRYHNVFEWTVNVGRSEKLY